MQGIYSESIDGLCGKCVHLKGIDVLLLQDAFKNLLFAGCPACVFSTGILCCMSFRGGCSKVKF